MNRVPRRFEPEIEAGLVRSSVRAVGWNNNNKKVRIEEKSQKVNVRCESYQKTSKEAGQRIKTKDVGEKRNKKGAR